MKDMVKPYLVVTGENAWSKPASEEIFNAAKSDVKQLEVIPEAGHFDLYDLYPYVDEVVAKVIPFFDENL